MIDTTKKCNKDSLMCFRLPTDLHTEVRRLGLKLGPELREFVDKKVKSAKRLKRAK